MTISLRLTEADSNLIRKYAEMNHMSVSNLIRQSVIERIEDEYDLQMYREALAEHEKNPVTYSLDEVTKEIMDE